MSITYEQYATNKSNYETYRKMLHNTGYLERKMKENMENNKSIKNIHNIFISVKDVELQTYSLDVEYSDKEGYHRRRGVYSEDNLLKMFTK